MCPRAEVPCWKVWKAEHCRELLQYWTEFHVRNYWGRPQTESFFVRNFIFSEKKAIFVCPKKIKPCPNEPEIENCCLYSTVFGSLFCICPRGGFHSRRPDGYLASK